jgi:hypothetical protein
VIHFFGARDVEAGIAPAVNNAIIVASGEDIDAGFRLMRNDFTVLAFGCLPPTCIDGPGGDTAIGEAVSQNENKGW